MQYERRLLRKSQKNFKVKEFKTNLSKNFNI